MSAEIIQLPEVEEVRITLVMDNSIDALMPSTAVAKRMHTGANPYVGDQPMAEHGFSALIHLKQGDKVAAVLYDTGVSRDGVVHNMDVFEINPADIQAIVLSHGHADHANGLLGLSARVGRRNMPLVLHPDAYLERKVVLPSGFEVNLPPPRKQDLRREGIEVIEEVGPSMMAGGLLLVSGEVARTNDFETGFPTHWAKRRDDWEPDPMIMDDQFAAANVRGKGLVVVTGCGHSGIVNILRHAQALTGVDKIYAVLGGFHLTGPNFEPRIPATLAALQEMKPEHIMCGHCTGWMFTHQIARLMPEAFIPNSVGTTLVLKAD